jgi:tyrosine decarboxylase/aspartate 1-decarboxylase
VLSELKKIRKQDKSYDDGKILCSMCTKAHPIAEKAHQLYLSSNLGDPGLFPGSVQLEKEVINELATLLHSKNSVGFLVSGGTEANMMGLLAARNMACSSQPEVVLPKSAHFSFTKICNMLNLKPVYADLDSSFMVNLSSVEKCISKNTVAIVGTAGTAELGTVDPIEELAQIALTHNVWLHIDAAFGGLFIPFLNGKYKFDFSLEAVKSMTVDPHKMGMATIPAGGIFFRDNKSLEFIKTETPYLTDNFQYTFAGTRSGASAASAWAVFKFLGADGFKKIVNNCMKITHVLRDGLKDIGFNLIVEPTLNIVAFRSQLNTKRLAEKLWEKGWFVSYVPRYDSIRIVIMPHVKKRHALAFLKDLREIEKRHVKDSSIS